MPPLARAFVQLFIGVPGALLWVGGGLTGILLFAVLLFAHLPKPDVLATCAGLAGSLVAVSSGYLMQVLAGNLNGDPRFRFDGGRFPARFACDTAVDYCGILSAGACMGALMTLATYRWEKLAISSVLLLLFFYLLQESIRKRVEQTRLWEKERDALEAMRRVMDADGGP